MAEGLHVAMVAGEASSDLLGALLLGGLQAQWPAVQAHGIGGAQMVQRGFTAHWPSERLAVHGYSLEVLRRLRELLAMRRSLRDRLLREPPQVFIGVDAPDFNLGLEADLRAAGIPTVHFVCPSIWAWRPERVEKIRRATDHVLCLFPFEPALLAQHGIAATYVGHPLAQVIPLVPERSAARAALGLPPEGPVLAVLPGSRSAEIRYLAAPFLQAAALVRQAVAGLSIVVPAVPSQRGPIEAAVQAAGLQGAVTVLQGQSHAALAACDATLIASGTATLEAALFKRPMVIAYRMHPWSWRLMRRKQLQPWVGLPNILCADFVVPELLQERAHPQALAQAVLQALQASPEHTAALQARFAALHHELRRDTAQLASDAIRTVLHSRA